MPLRRYDEEGETMLVREILETAESFPTIATDDSVSAAASLMRSEDVRAVPVVEGDRLVGIVTDWDIVDAFAQRPEELATLPVSAIMTGENLITINADETAGDATTKLRQHRVHHLPVLEGDRYLGVICLGIEWAEEDMLTPPVRPTLTARRP
jgi:CBS domain-containing protein